MEETSVDVETKQSQAETTASGNENEQQTQNRVSLNSHSKDEVLDGDPEKQILTDENKEKTGGSLSPCPEEPVTECDKAVLSEETEKTIDSCGSTSLSPGHNNIPPLQDTDSEMPVVNSNEVPKLVDQKENSNVTEENVETSHNAERITQETMIPTVGQCEVGVENLQAQDKPGSLTIITADCHSPQGESEKPESTEESKSSDNSKSPREVSLSQVECSNVEDYPSTTEEKLEPSVGVTTDIPQGDSGKPESTKKNEESSDDTKSAQPISSLPAEHSTGDEASTEEKLKSFTGVTIDCNSSLGNESKSTKRNEESSDDGVSCSQEVTSSPAEFSNAVYEANKTGEELKIVMSTTDCHSASGEDGEPKLTEKNEESSDKAQSHQKLEAVSSSAGQNQSSQSQDEPVTMNIGHSPSDTSTPNEGNVGAIIAGEKSDISSTLEDKASSNKSDHKEKKSVSPISSPSSSNGETEKNTTKEPDLDTSIEIIKVIQSSKQEKQKDEIEEDDAKRVNCVEISSSESDCYSSSEKYDSDEVYCLSDDDDLICVSDKNSSYQNKSKIVTKTNPSMSYQCGEVTYSIIREGLAKQPRDNPSEKDASLEPNITIELIPIKKGANTDKKVVPPIKENGSKSNDDSIWLISDDEADKPDEEVSSKRKRDHSDEESQENTQVNSYELKKPRKDSDAEEQRMELKKTSSNAEDTKQSEHVTSPNVNTESSPHSKSSSNEVEVLSVSDDSAQGTDGIDSEKDMYDDENSINSVVVYNDEMMDYTYSDPIYVESDSDKETVPSSIQITSVTSSVSFQTKDSAVTSSDANEMDHETELEPESKEQNSSSSAVENSSEQSVNTSKTSSAGEAKDNCEQSSEITDSGT